MSGGRRKDGSLRLNLGFLVIGCDWSGGGGG